VAKSKKNVNRAGDSVVKTDRRNFLKGAAAGAAVLAANPRAVAGQQLEARRVGPPPMSAEAEAGLPAHAEVLTTDRPGSDFMVDVLKSLNADYVFANPGSSFRGLHESLLNYGGNQKPEFITCCHEESSVAMAQGYAKVEGKPVIVLVHGTVGLQHASMAIYNAFCDRVPVYLIAGNTLDATKRRPGAEWTHSVQDAAAMVRDYIKWDDMPMSLAHFAESAVRAYKIAMTPPMMPVMLVADSELQENPIAPNAVLHIPKLTLDTPPQGDSAAVAEAARMLVAAENPVIIADHTARTPVGMARLIELAEALQAPVVDEWGRMNFPTRHPLNQTERSHEVIANADVILGLEAMDLWGALNNFRDQLYRTSTPIAKPGAKVISITAGDLYTKSNYQDFERFPEVDLAIAGDAEATLPSLIEAVKRNINGDRKQAFQARGTKLAAARQQALERARTAASYGWDASPITTARVAAEIWAQVKNEDWALVSDVTHSSYWALRLWNFEKHYQYIGGAGGYGIGYAAPAALGAAIANKKYGRLTVAIQDDGDLMYANGVLWTSAHHQVPLLSVMHNNRAYHQELMHVQRMADRRSRGLDRCVIGTAITDPNVDYAKIAQGMGVYGEGPISDPKELGPALKRAIQVVKRGEPALVDVVTDGR
jgi:acetolactate synthase I/II/III large subunit